MKTLQILIFVSVIGLALLQVFGAAEKRAAKNDVFVVKNEAKAQQSRSNSANNVVGAPGYASYQNSLKSSYASGAIDTIGQNQRSEIVQTDSPSTENTGKQKRDLEILALSWSTFFDEWQSLFLSSINAEGSVLVDGEQICRIHISGMTSSSIRLIFSESARIKADGTTLSFFDGTSLQHAFTVSSNYERLTVTSSELLRFCQENATIVNYAFSR